MADKVTYEIKAQLGVIQEYPTGWKKEMNMVSWNGNAAKIDIRDWDENHEKMSRGITLNEKEVANLLDIVTDKAPEIKEVFAKEKARVKAEQEQER